MKHLRKVKEDIRERTQEQNLCTKEKMQSNNLHSFKWYKTSNKTTQLYKEMHNIDM